MADAPLDGYAASPPGNFEHWRAAFGASDYTSSSEVLSDFSAYAGSDTSSVGTRTYKFRRSNDIARIDAVLATTRVYPGEDVSVGFNALDADGNRFVNDDANKNRLKLKLTIGDTTLTSGFCTRDESLSVGSCTISKKKLTQYFTNTAQTLDAFVYVYAAQPSVSSSVQSGLLAPDPTLSYDDQNEVKSLLSTDVTDTSYADGKVLFVCSAAAVWAADSPDFVCKLYLHGGTTINEKGTAPFFVTIVLDLSAAASHLKSVTYEHQSDDYDERRAQWSKLESKLEIKLESKTKPNSGLGYLDTLHTLGTLTLSLDIADDLGYTPELLDQYQDLYASALPPLFAVDFLEIGDITYIHLFAGNDAKYDECDSAGVTGKECYYLNDVEKLSIAFVDHDGLSAFNATAGPRLYVRYEVASGIIASPLTNARALVTDSTAQARARVSSRVAFSRARPARSRDTRSKCVAALTLGSRSRALSCASPRARRRRRWFLRTTSSAPTAGHTRRRTARTAAWASRPAS